MPRVRLWACALPLLALPACTSPEPASAPTTPSVATPLTQTGPNTPDQRPVTAVHITYRGGTVTTSGNTGPLAQGTVVDITVLSDVDDWVLIEPLALSTPLTGGSGRLQFTAIAPGLLPIRLRDKAIELSVLEVR